MQIMYSEVEDEFHFIMHCPRLSVYRADLFESLALVIPSFPDTCMSEIEKFEYSLSSNDLDICKICTGDHIKGRTADT